jgi:hypothetical protein
MTDSFARVLGLQRGGIYPQPDFSKSSPNELLEAFYGKQLVSDIVLLEGPGRQQLAYKIAQEMLVSEQKVSYYYIADISEKSWPGYRDFGVHGYPRFAYNKYTRRQGSLHLLRTEIQANQDIKFIFVDNCDGLLAAFTHDVDRLHCARELRQAVRDHQTVVFLCNDPDKEVSFPLSGLRTFHAQLPTHDDEYSCLNWQIRENDSVGVDAQDYRFLLNPITHQALRWNKN